jgi:small subunit ribosomal protein S8e
MGISRDSRHKRRGTGGRMPIHKKKRKFEMARQPSLTKMGTKNIKLVRGRGGNMKYRALRLDIGNFCWPSEGVAKKVKIVDVVYNASNNELVRTKTIVKNCIVQIDSAPFRTWFIKKYNKKLGRTTDPAKEPKKDEVKEEAQKKLSKHLLKKKAARNSFIDPNLEEQFNSGRLLACISSRPGQVGRADGYILEGKELEFYMKKMEKKKKI